MAKENFEVYEIEMNVYFEDINSMGYKTFLIEQGTNIKNDTRLLKIKLLKMNIYQ